MIYKAPKSQKESGCKTKGNILRTEGTKFSMMINNASHYLFCYTSKP